MVSFSVLSYALCRDGRDCEKKDGGNGFDVDHCDALVDMNDL